MVIAFVLVMSFMAYNYHPENTPFKESKVYQGPLRLGDDEVLFRQTGITKSLIEGDSNGDS